MTRKQKTGLFLGIFIPLGVVATVVVVFPLIIILLLIIGFNWPYYIHRPAILQQAGNIFEDSEGHVYHGLTSYDSDSLYETKNIKMLDDDGNSLNQRKVIFDDNYICVVLDDGHRNNAWNCYVFIYDKSFDFIERLNMPDDYFIDEAKLINGHLYYTLREGETGDTTLFKYSISTKETKTIKEHIEIDTPITDGDVNLYFNRSYRIDYLEEKTILTTWFEKLKKGYIKHYIFADKVDVSFTDKEYRIVVEGDSLIFDKKESANTFCDEVLLIDNKLIFATYEKTSNKDCGSVDYYYCICRQGKSFLYCFDLETKQLALIKEYVEGTFLVDYDLEGARYYYDGGLYINDDFHRECEKIEPGEIEEKRGESAFYPDDAKLNYYIAFYKGEFYGI